MCRGTSEKLKICSDSFNLVIEFLPHPFYVIDADTYKIVLANSAAKMGQLTEESTCYALTHLRSSPCDDSEHPCPLKVVKETKKPVSVEHIHFDGKGNPINVEVRAYPILDSEGNLSQLIEYSLDITERKRAEQAQRAMECLRVLVQTAGAAAHEINQPLQVILTTASRLLRKIGQSDPNRDGLEEIIEQVARINQIVRQMKSVQRYATTPYVGDSDIVDFSRSCLEDGEEK